MGSFIELNDTLQITDRQGFPSAVLNLEKHRKRPVKLSSIKNKVLKFYNKPGARIYHPAPCRCFLVQNINGKWLYWGKIVIIEQTIRSVGKGKHVTSGKYKIIKLYDTIYQEQITKHESPAGKGYF